MGGPPGGDVGSQVKAPPISEMEEAQVPMNRPDRCSRLIVAWVAQVWFDSE